MTKEEIAQSIIERVRENSKKHNGNGEINYAYSVGALESVVKSIIGDMPQEVIEVYSKRIEQAKAQAQ
jgi:hypothetical protein